MFERGDLRCEVFVLVIGTRGKHTVVILDAFGAFGIRHRRVTLVVRRRRSGLSRRFLRFFRISLLKIQIGEIHHVEWTRRQQLIRPSRTRSAGQSRWNLRWIGGEQTFAPDVRQLRNLIGVRHSIGRFAFRCRFVFTRRRRGRRITQRTVQRTNRCVDHCWHRSVIGRGRRRHGRR